MGEQFSTIVNFDKPPITEVALSVQFNPSPFMRNIHFGKLYEHFKDRYPIVEDKQKLPPQFEVFGGIVQPQMQFTFEEAPALNRTWFLSQDGNVIIQVQDDRLIMNWRKQRDDDVYPRFSSIYNTFAGVLQEFAAFFANNLFMPLQITQADIGYINIIDLDESELKDWLKLTTVEDLKPEVFNIILSEVVIRHGKAVARTHYHIHSVANVHTNKRGAKFDITYRGAPSDVSIASALELIVEGRKTIVQRFCDLTTNKAHAAWGKK